LTRGALAIFSFFTRGLYEFWAWRLKRSAIHYFMRLLNLTKTIIAMGYPIRGS
jgi:hypothetical protein